MKCKVLNTFIDGSDPKYPRIKTDEEFECTKERFEEIQKKGDYLKPIEQPKKADK